MKDASLKDLLEAGCHFGHRKERWHPKATEFIFQAREGIHIIDLVKTKTGLEKAAAFLVEAGKANKPVLFVATKRQAKGVVMEAAKRAGVAYLTNRWIGGFLTNWEEVKKNINKVNTMRRERTDGTWKKFVKHEVVKLEKYLRQLESVYSGVVELLSPPDIIFVVDIKRESNCLKEIIRRKGTSIAIVDTNADPSIVDYPIPANDDAVGSIQFIVNFLADAYIEGKELGAKEAKTREEKSKVVTPVTPVKSVTPIKKEEEKKKMEKVEKVVAVEKKEVKVEKGKKAKKS